MQQSEDKMNKKEEAEEEAPAKTEAGKRESSSSTSSAMYFSAADDDEDEVDDGDREAAQGGIEKSINDASKINAESSNSDDSEQDQETVKPANNGITKDTIIIEKFLFLNDKFTPDISDTAVSSRENLFEELSARLAAGEDIVGQALPDSSDSSADCIDDANLLDVDDPQLPTMKRMEQARNPTPMGLIALIVKLTSLLIDEGHLISGRRRRFCRRISGRCRE